MYLQEEKHSYDLIIIDLPDPNSTGLSKLYSTAFYNLVFRRLNAQGVMVTQASSPFYAPHAFWCIHNTIQTTAQESVIYQNMNVLPMRVNVPSFGEWGFVLASKLPFKTQEMTLKESNQEHQFITPELIPALFAFGRDLAPKEVKINRLTDPVLHQYYRQGWKLYYD